jgi:hypothetical protein
MKYFVYCCALMVGYPTALVSLPLQCPHLDNEALMSYKSYFPPVKGVGKDMPMDGYIWQILDAQNLDRTLINPDFGYPFVFSAARSDVTSRVGYEATKGGELLCSYTFLKDKKPVAQLTLKTTDSLKQPDHSFERWQAVPNNPEQAMETEEQQADKAHFRIQME